MSETARLERAAQAKPEQVPGLKMMWAKPEEKKVPDRSSD
jgi:hypothetical protein